jgi:4-amino-4-deoxy-L-arabinose transferase-like glycosyltransferase
MGWKTRADHITQFLLAWIIPSWIIFELVPTKLPHYTLPLYPALALLAALAVSKTNLSPLRLRLAFIIPVTIAVTLNIKLLGVIAPQLPNFWIAPQLQAAAAGRPVILLGYAEPSAVFLLGTKTQMVADADGAINDMQKTPGAIAAIDSKKRPEFIAAARKNHLRVRQISFITGFNLGRGKPQELTLFTKANHEIHKQ